MGVQLPLLPPKEKDMDYSGFVTHHHACDCREAEFAAIRAENERLREALEKIRDMEFPEDDWDEPGMEAVDIASAALEKLK